VIRLKDVIDAEKRYDAAVAELQDYQRSDDAMFESMDKSGAKHVNVFALRFEKMEHLQKSLSARQLELQHIKRAWLGLEA
jgi:hypothetical protein